MKFLRSFDRHIYSWALYDWANSAFTTTVITAFFPIFYKSYWAVGQDASVGTLQLGLMNSVGSIFVAILAPILGAMADLGGKKRNFLATFAMVGIVATLAMSFVGKGNWQAASVLFVIASVGFAGSLNFYDSQINDICEEKQFHMVSALGYSLGYLGGGILLVVNVAMTLKPELFGLADKVEAVKYSFISVAVWWFVFSLPNILLNKDKHQSKLSSSEVVRQGFLELRSTLSKIRKRKNLLIFLAAYFLYIDGVGSIAKMAVDYGMSVGLESSDLIKALILAQFVGFPAAILFGYIGNKIGAKGGIFITLGFYSAASIGGYWISESWQFYALAGVIGFVQGGAQSLSRSYFAKLIPADHSAEFFGFYNMFGKFAAVIGPSLMGFAVYLTGNPRMSIVALIILFAGGGALLTLVKSDEPEPA